MAQRTKSKKRAASTPRIRWWSSIDRDRWRRWLIRVGVTVLALTAVTGGSMAVARLETHVDRQLADRFGSAKLAFLDQPAQLAGLVLADLTADVADLMTRPWTDDRLCNDLAARIGANAWVAHLRFVRRTSDGRFEVGARYRTPVATVQQGDRFWFVDREGVRLPGTYLYDPRWKIVQGVQEPPPEPGAVWNGDDLKAGLAVLSALADEPFCDQVTAVLVDNVGGRRNRYASHVELATDRSGGRIRWGSAPGFEMAENRPNQKLAILRANYHQTGRVDAGHPIIDISTYPDRFTIPG